MVQLLNKNIQLGDTINELYRIFDLFNKKFFDNKLEYPIIIIQSKRKNTLGTCSVNRVWKNKETENKNEKYEITLSAEHLHRPIEELCGTLLHEMIHLYCSLNNIKDTSNNHVYHNKNFKAEAEKRGLIIEYAQSIGWSVTTLQPNTKDLIKTFEIKEDLFLYYRQSFSVIKKLRIKYSELSKEEKIEYLKDKQVSLETKLDKISEKLQTLEQ